MKEDPELLTEAQAENFAQLARTVLADTPMASVVFMVVNYGQGTGQVFLAYGQDTEEYVQAYVLNILEALPDATVVAVRRQDLPGMESASRKMH